MYFYKYIINLILPIFASLQAFAAAGFAVDQGDSSITDENVSSLERGFYRWQDYIVPDVIVPSTKTYINSVFGNLIHQRFDYEANEGTFPVKLQFTYNSSSGFASRYGKGWQFNYNIRYVTNNINKHVIIVRPDDRCDLFLRQTDGTFISTYGVADSLVALPTGYKLINRNDYNMNGGDYSEYYFDSPSHHYITRIVDRNSIQIQFIYDKNKALSYIIIPSGRFISFAYMNNLLASISDGRNIARYSYSKDGNLIETRTFFNKINYGYEGICGKLNYIKGDRGRIYRIEYNEMFSVSKILASDTIMLSRIEYDSNLRQTAVYDYYNNPEIYRCDDKFRSVEYRDRLNNVVKKSWNKDYDMTDSTDKNGNITAFRYDKHHNVVTILYPDGAATTYQYNDKYNKLIKVTDENDNHAYFSYDNKGNHTSLTDPQGAIKTFNYDNSGMLVAATDEKGSTIIIHRNASGLPTAIYTPTGDSIRFLYNSFGQLISYIDGTGNVFGFHRNEFNKIDYIMKPDGKRINFSYLGDYLSLVEEIAGGGFNKTTYTYGSDLKPASIRDALGSNEYFRYDRTGRLVAYTDKNSNTSYYNYNIAGRLASTIPANSDTIVYKYDNNGNTVSISHSSGKVAIFEYNNRNLLRKTTKNSLPDCEFSYYKNGLLKSITDYSGNRLALSYDKCDRLVKIVKPLGITEEFARDEADNLIGFTDPLGYFYKFEYDRLYRISTLTDPLGFKTLYEYTASNRLSQKTDASLFPTIFQYDSLNNLKRSINPDNSSVDYYYDTSGNIVELKNNNGFITAFEYDEVGRLSKATDPLGYSESFARDPNGNLTAYTDKNDNKTKFAYGKSNELVSWTNPDGGVFSYEYFKNNMIASIKNPEGDQIKFLYDDSDRLTKIITPSGSKVDFNYDKSGNLAFIADGIGSPTSFGYDALGRLVSRTDPMGFVISFNYDANSNIKKTIDSRFNTTSFYFDKVNRPITFVNALGDSTALVYDPSGNVTSVKNEDGSLFRLEYNLMNKISSITNPYGDFIGISYDYCGNITSLRNERGFTTRYSYDKNNRLIRIFASNNSVYRLSYDGVGNLTEFIYPNNDSLKFSYNNMNNLTTKIYPNGTTLNYHYNALGNPIKIEDENKFAWQYLYDPLGRLLIRTSPLNGKLSYEYDPAGNIVSATYPLGNKIQIFYDRNRLPLSLQFAQNDMISYLYDPNGNITKRLDPNGLASVYYYDELDRPVRIFDQANRSTRISYTKTGMVKTLSIDSKPEISIKYDKINRLSLVTIGSGAVWQNDYDKSGNSILSITANTTSMTNAYDQLSRTTESRPATGGATKYEYDTRGLLASIKDPFLNIYSLKYNKATCPESIKDPPGNSIVFGYDPANNLTSLRNLGGNSYSFKYNKENRIVSILTPVGNKTSIDYDNNSNITTLISPAGRSTQYTYDYKNRCRKIIQNSGEEYEFIFDQPGYILRRKFPLDNFINHRYDLLYRLSTIVYPNNYFTSFDYDQADNTTQIYEYNSHIFNSSFLYNTSNRIETIIASFGNILRKTYSILYDAAGRLRSIIDTSFSRIDMDYDPNGNLVEMSQNGSLSTYFSTDSTGLLKKITYPNGFSASYTYNSINRITNLKTYNDKPELIREFSYLYNPAGNLLQVTDQTGSTTFFDYDPESNIRVTGYSDGKLLEYYYDSDGNRIREKTDGISTDYTYDTNGRLVARGNWRYYYDAGGNLISKSLPGSITNYYYDYNNRLVKAVLPDSTQVEYQYNTNGNIVYKKSADTSIYIPESLFEHLPTKVMIRQKFNTGGNLKCQYELLNTGNQSIDGVLSARMPDEGSTYFFHKDAFGNIVLISDMLGNTYQPPSFDHFGKINSNNDSLGLLFGYKSLEYHDEIDMYYSPSGFYDPSIARNITKAPTGYGEGLNLYKQVGNPFTTQSTVPLPKRAEGRAIRLDYYEKKFSPFNNKFSIRSAADELKRVINRLFAKQLNSFKTFNVDYSILNTGNVNFKPATDFLPGFVNINAQQKTDPFEKIKDLKNPTDKKIIEKYCPTIPLFTFTKLEASLKNPVASWKALLKTEPSRLCVAESDDIASKAYRRFLDSLKPAISFGTTDYFGLTFLNSIGLIRNYYPLPGLVFLNKNDTGIEVFKKIFALIDSTSNEPYHLREYDIVQAESDPLIDLYPFYDETGRSSTRPERFRTINATFGFGVILQNMIDIHSNLSDFNRKAQNRLNSQLFLTGYQSFFPGRSTYSTSKITLPLATENDQNQPQMPVRSYNKLIRLPLPAR